MFALRAMLPAAALSLLVPLLPSPAAAQGTLNL